MTIRRAIESDLAGVLMLVAAVPESPSWSEYEFARMLRDEDVTAEVPGVSRYAWVGVHEGQICGLSVLHCLRIGIGQAGPALECEIELVIVDPRVRRRAVGSRLVEVMIGWCASAGAQALRLEVRASNEAAIRLYTAAGFHETGRRAGYYQRPEEDALLMECLSEKMAGKDVMHRK